MTKIFSKILVVCALVTIIPLMAVGVTFANYFSIEATVKISAITTKDGVAGEGSDAFTHVVYGDKAENSVEIKQGHKQKVSVGVRTKGYDFVGWFAGTKAEYDDALANESVKYLDVKEDNKLNFTIGDYNDKEILAVFQVKKYTVQYSYKAKPTDDNDTITTPETDDNEDATTKIYNYGELLPKLTYSGDEFTFNGWKTLTGSVVSDEVYNRAYFGKELVTLSADWVQSRQVNVTYKDIDGNVISALTTKVYAGKEYTLKTVEESGKELAKGYKYTWKDELGNAISKCTPEDDVVFKMDREAIVFNVTVDEKDVVELKYNKTKTMQFTVENASSLQDLFEVANWDKKYLFINFEGVEFAETLYKNQSSLSDAIVNAGKLENSVKVSFKAGYTKFKATGKVEFKGAIEEGSYTESLYKGKDSSKFQGVIDPDYVGSEKVMSGLYSEETVYSIEVSGEKKPAQFIGFTITIGGRGFFVEVNDKMTWNDVVNEVIKKCNENKIELPKATEAGEFVVDAMEADFILKAAQ